MTITEMLGQSGILTLLGMGIVFGFLILMIAVISLAGKIINRTDTGSGSSAAYRTETSTAAPIQTDEKISAAISAAITEYRKSN